MTSSAHASEMRLYDRERRRLYLNAAERERFVAVARRSPAEVRTFCLTLLYTGCRISEALSLSPSSVQVEDRVVAIRSLKKRRKVEIREVPIPRGLAEDLERSFRIAADPGSGEPLWRHAGARLTRGLGYRWVKAAMREAGVEGVHASPKGLRHGYGVHATRSGVQLHMLQRWMGHADMATTAIYATAVGPEELEIADRMWGEG
ncbi:MAG: tyrosine-type recombinase/integrase [Pseudomonadota bacterium]